MASTATAPPILKDYITAHSGRVKVDPDELIADVQGLLGKALDAGSWLLLAEQCELRQFGSHFWRCRNCGEVHATDPDGVCTLCRKNDLERCDYEGPDPSDYYVALGATAGGISPQLRRTNWSDRFH